MRTRGGRVPAWALGALVLAPTVLHAATTLFLSSEAGDYVGGGRQYVYSSADGTFTLGGDRSRVSVAFTGVGIDFWSFLFVAPMGQLLMPGQAYVVDPPYGLPDQGRLYVSGQGRGCGSENGRFVIRELTVDAFDRPTSLAVDFEQRCGDSGPTLFGALRVRSGLAVCDGAADGTPCDDLDACTAGDTCRAGSCGGQPAVTCTATAPCIDSHCDPAIGSCRTAGQNDGIACDDGNPLTTGTVCDAGVCTQCPAFYYLGCDDGNACTSGDQCNAGACQGAPVDCDDGNPCTDDRCDPAVGCAHDVVPGCFLTVGRAMLSASASGQVQGRDVDCPTVRCQRIAQGILFLPGDGTYRAPAGETTCIARDVPIPDEVGRLRPRRDGRLRLQPTNRAEIRRALRRCRGRRLVIGDRSWIRLSADGRELTGTSRASVTIFDVLPIHASIVAHLSGRLGAFPDPPDLKPRPGICPEQIRLVCYAR